MPRSTEIVLGAGTVVHHEGRILVVKRAQAPHKGLWAFPGGRVEAGETPAQAAVRETKEEVGLLVDLEGVFEVVTYLPGELGPGNSNQSVIVDYLAAPRTIDVRLNGESTDFAWATPEEVVRLRTTPQMKDGARKFAKLGIR